MNTPAPPPTPVSEAAMVIARQVIAEKKDADHAPHSANMVRAGKWDDQHEVQDAYLGALRALSSTQPAQELAREEVARECQAVWRCAIGDAVGALDVLKGRWEESRRKADREAGAALASFLDLVWAARDPAARSYSEAAANGKSLIERVRTFVSPPAGGGRS